MKNKLLSILLVLSFKLCLADQFGYPTIDQAKETQDYLKPTKFTLLWGACCDEDIAEKSTTKNAYNQKLNDKDSYQVIIEKKNKKEEYVSKDSDFMYAHILKNDF
jgi:hypothetical protein